MRTLLRIEEAFLFLLSVFLFSRIGYAWWWFPLSRARSFLPIPASIECSISG